MKAISLSKLSYLTVDFTNFSWNERIYTPGNLLSLESVQWEQISRSCELCTHFWQKFRESNISTKLLNSWFHEIFFGEMRENFAFFLTVHNCAWIFVEKVVESICAIFTLFVLEQKVRKINVFTNVNMNVALIYFKLISRNFF